MGTDLSDILAEGGEEIGARIDAAGEEMVANSLQEARKRHASEFAPPAGLKHWRQLPTLWLRPKKEGGQGIGLKPCVLWRGDDVELAELQVEHFLGEHSAYVNGALFLYLPERKRLTHSRSEGPGWTRIAPERARRWTHDVFPGAKVFEGFAKDGGLRCSKVKGTAARARGVEKVLADLRTPPEGEKAFWLPHLPGLQAGPLCGLAQFEDVAIVVWQDRPGHLAYRLTAPHPDLKVRSTHVLPSPLGSVPEVGAVADDCPTFTKICREWWGHHGDEEMAARRSLLLEFIGAAVLGLAPYMGRALLLEGPGGTGKSSVIDAMMGWLALDPLTGRRDESRVPKASVSPYALDDDRFASSSLDGTRYNFVDDNSSGKTLDDAATFKSSITGGMLRVQRKGENAFDIRCEAAHFVLSNGLPRLRRPDSGFFRRWAILEWDRTFHGTAEERDIRPEMTAEMPQIVRHAVAALLATGGKGGRGYTEPECHGRLMDRWQEKADSSVEFVHSACKANACEKAAYKWPKGLDLYKVYCRWAEDSGRRAMGKGNFYESLRNQGVTESDSGGCLRFNLKITDPEMLDTDHRGLWQVH